MALIFELVVLKLCLKNPYYDRTILMESYKRASAAFKAIRYPLFLPQGGMAQFNVIILTVSALRRFLCFIFRSGKGDIFLRVAINIIGCRCISPASPGRSLL